MIISKQQAQRIYHLHDEALEKGLGQQFVDALKIINQDDAISKLTKKFSDANAKKLLSAPMNRVELAKERLPYEKLDQLTMEVLMGVR